MQAALQGNPYLLADSIIFHRSNQPRKNLRLRNAFQFRNYLKSKNHLIGSGQLNPEKQIELKSDLQFFFFSFF